MHVRMSVWGEPEEHLVASLENWLQLDPELHGTPVIREARHDDRLSVVLPADRTPSALAGALSTWLSTRIGDVRLNVTGPDGTVEVSVANIADHDALLREALGSDQRR
ncbi:hypothetical protein [Kineosporia sp. NBRC 101731]|uniref:effector-associated constant component EACC1 n=1 Tax=Kineosporia sp. NBRC 101731 TaxID=3032199 RepID=UPI0024A23509|nr:hypothetical protein [Kineosporia sp. NBRC 101731]GLY28215.1 hypothetical protein Kisp02_15800 [Kineosporia sp. NBRC 101731]